MNKPIITIITVSYNAKSIIEETILSVINQTYPNIEYIVIDGGSTDGTIDIIKKYENKITQWISEPDKGIYDAMNKGINLATGEWINFMNCGDSFCNENTLELFINKIEDNNKYDIVYGNTIINCTIGKYKVLPEKLENLSIHMPFCHQSTFVQTKLAQKRPFDLQYKYVADYNFFYHAYQNRNTFKYIDLTIANYQIDEGYSASNMNKCIIEAHKINNKKLSTFNKLAFKFRAFLINNLPKKIVYAIRSVNYKNNERYINLH